STSLPAFVKRFMYETKASAASPSHLSCTVSTACCTALPRLPASVAASRNRPAASEATLLLMLPTCLYNAERSSPPEPGNPCRSATALAPAPSLTENLPTGPSRQPYCSPMSSGVNALTFSASCSSINRNAPSNERDTSSSSFSACENCWDIDPTKPFKPPCTSLDVRIA